MQALRKPNRPAAWAGPAGATSWRGSGRKCRPSSCPLRPGCLQERGWALSAVGTCSAWGRGTCLGGIFRLLRSGGQLPWDPACWRRRLHGVWPSRGGGQVRCVLPSACAARWSCRPRLARRSLLLAPGHPDFSRGCLQVWVRGQAVSPCCCAPPESPSRGTQGLQLTGEPLPVPLRERPGSGSLPFPLRRPAPGGGEVEADGLSATLLWVTCPPGRTHPGFCCGPRGWRAGWVLHARSCGSIPVTFPSVAGVDRGV